MLDPSAGLINSLLSVLNIPSQPFLISQDQALWCIVVIGTWKGINPVHHSLCDPLFSTLISAPM